MLSASRITVRGADDARGISATGIEGLGLTAEPFLLERAGVHTTICRSSVADLFTFVARNGVRADGEGGPGRSRAVFDYEGRSWSRARENRGIHRAHWNNDSHQRTRVSWPRMCAHLRSATDTEAGVQFARRDHREHRERSGPETSGRAQEDEVRNPRIFEFWRHRKRKESTIGELR